MLIVIDGEPPILSSAKIPIQPAPLHGRYPETKGWLARVLYGACPRVYVLSGTPISLRYGILSICQRLVGEWLPGEAVS